MALSFGKFHLSLLSLGILIAICKAENKYQDKMFTKEDFMAQLSKKNFFVMFFAPWCSHCEKLMPVWKDLAENYDTNDNFDIAKVDCTVQTELCFNQDITGYPSLKLYKIGENEGKKFRGTRDLPTLKRFIHSEIEDIGESATSNNFQSDDLIELNETTFLNYISVGNHFIKFFAPWCNHCQDLAPVWNELARSLINKEVTVAKMDCTKNKNVCSALDVVAYPTLLWIQDGKKIGTYQGTHSLKDLLQYVSRMLQPSESARDSEHKLKDNIEKTVLSLYEENFMSHINKGFTFVKFYAPWCGHCKRLAPTWGELAKKLSNEGRVTIASIDCTLEENKELCNKQKVKGYPTLFFYQNGIQVSEYNGSRELEDLLEFVKQHIVHDEL